jgi:hypothetical protein
MGHILTELTRRQMRELERSGKGATTFAPEPNAEVAPTDFPSEDVVVTPKLETPSLAVGEQLLTRRQMREAQDFSASTITPQKPPVPVESEARPIDSSSKGFSPRVNTLPHIGSERRDRNRVVESQVELPETLEPVEIEIPEDGFRGANYLGEPSTQSILLDVAPEAIELPLDTGEIFTTGSIAILPEAPGTSTGGLDGIDQDYEEAVTGVISIVDPVSALDLIDDRSPLGVVPAGVLRRGWWRPWAVGALSLVMAIAAILASITIFNALGA